MGALLFLTLFSIMWAQLEGEMFSRVTWIQWITGMQIRCPQLWANGIAGLSVAFASLAGKGGKLHFWTAGASECT